MTELLLIGMFTAFCLAVLKPFINLLSVLGGGLAINASFALGISSIPVYLVVNDSFPALVVWAIAGGYFGSFLLALAERVATHRPAVINQTRPE
jgi:hypothetical protein